MLKIPVLGQLARLGEALGGGIAPIVYLLLDQFTTNQGAPITTPRTCEPGPGTLNIVQSGGTIEITGQKLKITGSASMAKQGYYSGVIARAVGRAYATAYRSTAVNNRSSFFFLSDSTTLGNGVKEAIYRGTSRLNVWEDPTFWIDTYFPITDNTDYLLAIVQRTAGAFYLIRGGVYTNWTLIFIGWADTSANLRLEHYCDYGAGNYDQIDDLAVVDLDAPWDDVYGIVTQRLAGARSVNDTLSHNADCHLWMTLTRPTSGSIDFRFRIQDASNYWQIAVDTSGNLTLNEIVGGTPTTRGTRNGMIGTGTTIRVIAYGTRILIADSQTRVNYASATNFATATSGLVAGIGTGGAMSDLVSWPVTLSGAAATALEAVVPT